MASTHQDAVVVAHEATSMLPEETAIAVRAAMSAVHYEALREGVRRYAWFRNGVKYVGTGAITLERAIAGIDDAEQAGEWEPT